VGNFVENNIEVLEMFCNEHNARNNTSIHDTHDVIF